MGGGGGQQTTTQVFTPPKMTEPYWQSYVDSINKIAQTPYVQSGIAQNAPINNYQLAGNQLAYDMATYGTPMGNAANSAAYQAASGNYANPYAQNVTGIASGQAYNPALQGYAASAQSSNPYATDQYTQQIIGNTAGQMTKAYQEGTAAQQDAAANMAGAFGGGGWQAMNERGAQGLAANIGNMAANVQQAEQQYQGNMYNQDFANRMNALAGYSGAYNQDVANQLNANAQAGGMWQNDIGNILQGAALGYQGNNDYRQNINGLTAAGDKFQNQYQKFLDQYNNQWNTQNQYDYTMQELLGQALSRASGTWGGSTQTAPGTSPLQGLLGLGALGAGMYGLYK